MSWCLNHLPGLFLTLVCVVYVSGCWGLAPITHRKQALALNTQEVQRTQETVPQLLVHISLTPSSCTPPRRRILKRGPRGCLPHGTDGKLLHFSAVQSLSISYGWIISTFWPHVHLATAPNKPPIIWSYSYLDQLFVFKLPKKQNKIWLRSLVHRQSNAQKTGSTQLIKEW